MLFMGTRLCLYINSIGLFEDVLGVITMTQQFFIIHDMVQENGKTIKENNLEKVHDIPIGALVEVEFDEWFGEGACWKVHARLWVVGHNRDCDGTPLYSLSRWKDPSFALQINHVHSGFDEESLSIVKITDEIRQGEGALEVFLDG